MKECRLTDLFRHVTLILLVTQQTSGSGIFQIQPLAFVNDGGLNATGNCCTGSRTNGRCGAPCRTYFQVCLSHYQSSLPADVACTFGKVRTSTLGVNSIYFQNKTPISIPFDFTWPGSFTLIFEAWHNSSANGINLFPRGSSDSLIFRVAILDSLEAGDGWHLYDNASSDLPSITFRFRVICNTTYFGPGCSETCQPRDDKFGHYRCGPTGMKVCQSGWTGQYCDKAVCLDGCHPDHGFCEDPNECKCRLGWQGKLCRQCIPYPGCQHGSCDLPWQCNCEEGWGGLFCNQDLNFCTNYRPCRNGGTCTNAGQGSYACTCPSRFTGTNCELEMEDCDHVSCQNGGICTRSILQSQCLCPSDFYGSYCQWSVSKSCDLGPCMNNGTCLEENGQYQCFCPTGFTGLNCETKLDACTPNPCLSGGRCVTSASGRSFACHCGNGYSGQFCQDSHNHCAGSPCLNGATCLPDASEGFICQCVAGFVGVLCQDDVDDCLNYPCANGATCTDLVNDFRCACAAGFFGRYCSENVSSCAFGPCSHGATCLDRPSGFECLCTTGYYGKRCEQDGVTLPLLGAKPDKQIVGDVTSAINMQQIVLIVVFGVGLPVFILLFGVVLLIVKKRRRRDDVTVDDSNVHSYGYNDVNNRNEKQAAAAAAAGAAEMTSSDVRTGRPLKNTNEERAQCSSKEHELQRSIYTIAKEHSLNEPEAVKRFTVNQVTAASRDCTCDVRRTCRFHSHHVTARDKIAAEQEIDKESLTIFPPRIKCDRPSSTEGFPASKRNPEPYPPTSRTTRQHQSQDFVLATEV